MLRVDFGCRTRLSAAADVAASCCTQLVEALCHMGWLVCASGGPLQPLVGRRAAYQILHHGLRGAAVEGMGAPQPSNSAS